MSDRDAVKRGRWLRNLRRDRKLTQKQLAELAGTNEKTIREMEKGRTEHPWTLSDVLAALDVSESDMETEESVAAEDEIDDETLREMLHMMRRYPAGVFHALLVWGAFLSRMTEPELTDRISHVSIYLAEPRP